MPWHLAGLFVISTLLVSQTIEPPAAALDLRLVFVQRNLRSESHIDDIREIARRASEHGYTGMVLSGSFDGIPKKPDEYFYRLQTAHKICTDYGLEFIPLLFSVGYGGLLSHDRNLAAAVPVRDLPIMVKDGKGVLTRDPSIGWEDGGFERCKPGEAPAKLYCDDPGTVSVVDTDISNDGTNSLRFQNLDKSKGGQARIIKTMAVQPFRCYELRCWVKTENLESNGGFVIQVHAENGRILMFWPSKIKGTSDWTEVRTGFNSLDFEKVRIYAGVWRGETGRFWVDDIRVREVGFLNVLRRPGTPITVKGESTGILYEEGTDYEISTEEKLSYKFDHPEPVLRTIPGGRIGENEPLRVDYYQAIALKGGGQIGICMSEQKAYDIWRGVVETVHEMTAPDYYFISADEIRHGGWCEACRSRELTAGELVGDCFTHQVQIIRSVNPNAKVIIWSDMLDPNHNAVDNFYLFNGNLAGSWNHVPKDLIIACWKYKTRVESLKHFEENGFRTIGCGYYDTKNLENATGWIESLHGTKGACGIMYTTWQNQYDLLEAFGDRCIE